MIKKLWLKYGTDLRIILIAMLFYLGAWCGYRLVFPESALLTVWPASGIAFALMIISGRKIWPGIMIGALLGNLLSHWNSAISSQSALLLFSLFVAVGQTAETLAGNFLVSSWLKTSYPFSKTRLTFQFLFVSLLMGIAGAVIISSGLYIARVIPYDLFPQTVLAEWAARVTGILLLTPLILSVTRLRKANWSWQKGLEGVAVLVSISIVVSSVLLTSYNSTIINALPFLLIPFLLWLAFRFDLFAGMLVTSAASLLAIYFSISNAGPFVLDTTHDSILLLQIFIGVVSISTIVLSATVTERGAAQEELKQFNANLESMVKNRTKELNDEIINRITTEQQLIRTNEELSKRNQELDNFVYSVSHDLRAPIASVLGLIHLAEQDKNPDNLQLYLSKINQSARQQDAFIREILDHSRNSRLEIRKEPIRFEPLIQETFEQLKFATSTGKDVKRVITVNQDQDFMGDKWRLKVILNNIISNAIRYRNGRSPIIKINVDIQEHLANLSIEDNGRGIAPEHLDKVCNMFYRATDEGAGSGLGLYIVKETIQKLNGTVSIESTQGKGTTVRLTIPELS